MWNLEGEPVPFVAYGPWDEGPLGYYIVEYDPATNHPFKRLLLFFK